MPIQDIGNLGRINVGGYPFNNQAVNAFNLAAYPGSRLVVNLVDTKGRIIGFIPEPDVFVPNPTMEYNYDRSHDGVVGILAQPDFEGVTGVTIRGAVQASSIDLTQFTDLETVVVRESRLPGTGSTPGGDPFETFPVDALPVNGIQKIVLRDIGGSDEFTAHIKTAVDAGAKDIEYGGLYVQDTLSELTGTERRVVIVGSAMMNPAETVQASQVGDTLEEWDTDGTPKITVDLGVFTSSTSKLKKLTAEPGKYTGSIENILTNNPDLEELPKSDGFILSPAVDQIPFDFRGLNPASQNIKRIAVGDRNNTDVANIFDDYYFTSWGWAQGNEIELVISQSKIGNFNASMSNLNSTPGDFSGITFAFRRRGFSDSKINEEPVNFPILYSVYETLINNVNKVRWFGRSGAFNVTNYSGNSGVFTFNISTNVSGDKLSNIDNGKIDANGQDTASIAFLMDNNGWYGAFSVDNYDSSSNEVTISQYDAGPNRVGPTPPQSLGANATAWGTTTRIQ